MRSDLTFGAAVQMTSYMVALATDQPAFLTKVLGILAGASLGALVAAMFSDQPTTRQRVRRFFSAFGAGAFLAVAALWVFPGRDGVDPREFVFVVSGIAAFIGWRFVEKLDARADRLSERVLDKIEERVGIAPHDREGGRIRPVVLVLLAALAVIAWLLRDVIWLIWIMATEGVGH